MEHTTSPQPLTILVVTEDRALQRQLSQFFDIVGYRAVQAADRQSAFAAVEVECPHIALIGSDLARGTDWELCRILSQCQPSTGLFKFLIVENLDENQLPEALEAGIDDFLLKPVDYGELLSRVRAAARVLEYDRRVCQQARVDPLTGLFSRSAFVSQLQSQLTKSAGASPRIACIVLDIDFFGRINRLHGAPACDALIKAIAQDLNASRVGSEVLSYLGANRFGVMLPDASDTAAAEWAEHSRRTLATTRFKLVEAVWQITASFGVAGCDAAENAEQLIELATQALQTAKSSGRNCVVRYGEFYTDSRALLAPDKIFERTVAWALMTPCSVFLQPDEPVRQALDVLHQTRLDAIAVVDADGKLLGLCEQVNVAAVPESEYGTRLVRDVMTTDIQSFEEDATLASLLDFFTRDSRSVVVVVNEARPAGFVTCDSLLALCRPVTTDSLAIEGKYSDTSEYLLVPDVRPHVGEHDG